MTQDTYNITVADDGGYNYVITGATPKIAQSYIAELEAAGVDFYLELVVKQVEAA